MRKAKETTKRGPRADRGKLKDAILDAAQQVFSAQGFEKAATKDIADTAGVDKKLIHYYFGSKDGLFTAILDRAFTNIEGQELLKDSLQKNHQKSIDLYLTRLLSLMEDPKIGPALIALVRSVSTYPPAAIAFNNFIKNSALSITDEIQAPETQTKLFLVGNQLFGLFTARYILKAPIVCQLSLPEVVNLVSPVLHAALTTSAPNPT